MTNEIVRTDGFLGDEDACCATPQKRIMCAPHHDFKTSVHCLNLPQNHIGKH